MNKLLFATSLSLSIMFSSCGDKATDEISENLNAEVVKDTTPVTVNEETKFKFDFAIANIPSPVGSVNEISTWGIDYNNALLVDSKKQLAASNEFSKAITLGIYNIDMAYAMVNNNGQDVLKYMKTIVGNADALGLKNSVDQMIGKRAESNLGNKDSLLNTKLWYIGSSSNDKKIVGEFLGVLCDAIQTYNVYYKQPIEEKTFTSNNQDVDKELKVIKRSLVEKREILKKL